jgi:hypothetical protein
MLGFMLANSVSKLRILYVKIKVFASLKIHSHNKGTKELVIDNLINKRNMISQFQVK